MIRGHNPHLVAEVMAYLLFCEATTGGGKSLTGAEILERLPDQTSTQRIIKFAIDELKSRRHVESDILRGELVYALTRSGFDYVKYRLSLTGTAIKNFSENEEWILSEEQQRDDAPVVENELFIEESSDDTWEPLPVERDSKKFVDALVASEEAERALREDNGFAANYPEIRDSVVWSVGSAINQMREGLITSGQVKSMLIAPFQKVASLFSEGLLKEACERAIEKLVALL
tara:strand:+ start:77029 stop:77721 length:693 start_codon:yes stop_codon:yes gene_type:complete